MKELDPQLQKQVSIGTETIEHTSHALNSGKPLLIEVYLVRCLTCKKDCSTVNVIDVDRTDYGRIQDPEVSLRSAKCKRCDKEWFF